MEEIWKVSPFTYRRQKIEVSSHGNVRVKGKILEKSVYDGKNFVIIGKTGFFAVEKLVAYGFKVTNHISASVHHLDGRPLNDSPYNLIPFQESFESAIASKKSEYRDWVKKKEVRKRREKFFQEELVKTLGIRILSNGVRECCKCQSHNIKLHWHHCECHLCEDWGGCRNPTIDDYYQCLNCGETEMC